MDFDLDDPLGDLLSDGSNDSFFGASKLKKKPVESAAIAATATRPTTASKSKMEHLFGIGADKAEEKAADTISQYSGNLNVTSSSGVASFNDNKKAIASKVATIAPETSDQTESDMGMRATLAPKPAMRKETSFGDSDDFFSELGFDPKRPKGGSARKSNILDDLLQGTFEVKNTPSTAPLRDVPRTPPRRTVNQRQPEPDLGHMSAFDSGSGRSASRQSPLSTRSRAPPSDPLGLFLANPLTDEASKKDADEPRPRLTKKSSMVDWLGLDTNKDNEVPVQRNETRSAQPADQQTLPVESQADHKSKTMVSNVVVREQFNGTLNAGMLDTMQMIGATEADATTALRSLQQQDTQLQIASQMRNQETALLDMQMKQQTLLRQQETNFNDMLRRQLSRQTALEDSIKRQQEQINAHIQLLMLQPNVPNMDHVDRGKDASSETIENPQRLIVELEADVKRLELEKIRLQDLLKNIRTNHEQEMDLTDLSHR